MRNKSIYRYTAGGKRRAGGTSHKYINKKIKRKNIIGKINRAVSGLLWGFVCLLLKQKRAKPFLIFVNVLILLIF